jgi:hypothetical protein
MASPLLRHMSRMIHKHAGCHRDVQLMRDGREWRDKRDAGAGFARHASRALRA